MSRPLNFAAHNRNWHNFRLVYPALSRRSRGLSIGVNLNPDRVCNFDCVYCEVNRKDFRPGKGLIPLPPKNSIRARVDLDGAGEELRQLLLMVRSGEIWQEPEFAGIDQSLRRLNDIAFSGDGEPTTYPHFSEAVDMVIKARRAAGYTPEEVKIVLITNATRFHRTPVQEGLAKLVANNGEIWAKLDAGTAEYFRLVDKTAIKYEQVLDNLLNASRRFPLNIQTCLMKLNGETAGSAEIEAYCGRLRNILDQGGQLKLVQLYTVARLPAQDYVSSLNNRELETIAATIGARTGLRVETFGGSVGL